MAFGCHHIHVIQLHFGKWILAYARMTIILLRLAISQNLAGGFILPVTPLLHRPVKAYRAGAGAIVNAAAAVPAFIRVQNDWGFLFFRIGDKDIYLADFHAVVAAGTDIRIENYRISRADNIG